MGLPLHYLFYIDDYDSYDGLDDHGFDYLRQKYPHMISSVRASVAWAAKNPDYDYQSLQSDYPYTNKQIYFYLRRFHETLEELIKKHNYVFPVQFDQSVEYVTEVGQSILGARVEDGILMDFKGPVDTTDSFRLFQGHDCKALYVIDNRGRLIISTYGAKGVMYHSALSRGEGVVCAGFIHVDQGRIVSIDRRSGHYKTDAGMLTNALRTLADQGIDVETIEVEGL